MAAEMEKFCSWTFVLTIASNHDVAFKDKLRVIAEILKIYMNLLHHILLVMIVPDHLV